MNSTRHFLPRFGGASSRSSRLGMLILRALLALVVFLPITPSQAFSPVNDTDALPNWRKYSADSPYFFTNMTDRSMKINPSTNAPCVAYGGDALYYSCQNRTTGRWTTRVVDSSVQVGEYAALDFNSKKWPFITYYDAYHARLKLAYYNGSQWRLLVVPNAETEIFTQSETAAPRSPSQPLLDENGMIPPPAISGELVQDQPLPEDEVLPEPFEVAPEEIIVPSQPDAPAAQPAPTATAAPTEDAAATEQPTVEPTAADATGQPAVEPTAPEATETPTLESAAPEITPQPTVQPTLAPNAQEEEETTTVEKIRAVLQPWLQPEAPNFPFQSLGYGKYSSIAIDRRDGVHITYHDEIDGSLDYVYWDGYDWWDIIVDDPHDQGDVGLWSSITVDYFYNVYIAYMDEKYDDLKFAFHNGEYNLDERWRVESIDGLETRVNMGSFSSIALEMDLTKSNEKTFIPHISYYDFTHDTLRHAWWRWDPDNERYYWDKETIDNGGTKGNVGWYTSIAVDSNDVVHVSYFDVGNGNLKYARKSGNSWSRSTLDSSGSSLTGLFTSIAIDGNSRPCISYLHGNTGELRVICRTNTINNRWRIYKVTSQGHDVGQATSVAVDQFGRVHVSYMDVTSGALKYARSFGSAFTLTTFGAPYAGRYSSIDTVNGYPRIAYDEQGQQEVMYASKNAKGWYYSQVDATYNVGQFVSMELDSNARPHISYYDATHKSLVYATYPVSATKWMTTTVDLKGEDVGWYSSLALDSNDTPWIAYYLNPDTEEPETAPGYLKIAMRSPTGTWVTRRVEAIGDLPEEGVGWYASLDIDKNGLPAISYYDFTNRRLRFASYSGTWGSEQNPTGNWIISTIDSALGKDIGRFTSLVINTTTNVRHVCYYDLTNTNLKYARFTPGVGWEKQIVDGVAVDDGDDIDEGDVGLFCSIDLSPAGNPVISYYDNSRADLKVASSFALTFPAGSLFLPVADAQ